MYSTLASVDSRPGLPTTPLLLVNQFSGLASKKNSSGLNHTGYFSHVFPWPVWKKGCNGRGMVTELTQKICLGLP